MTQGVAPMDDWTPAAQAGGAFAVVLAAIGGLAKGFAWLLNWHGERTDRKSAKLRAWEDSLERREREHREGIKAELGALKVEMGELRGKVGMLGVSLLEVTIELRVLDPGSAALERASGVLRSAFPTDFKIPPDLAEMAAKIDGANHKEGS